MARSPELRETLKNNFTKVLKETKYQGPDLSTGRTSRAGKASPFVRSFFGNRLSEGDVILDYGAGKYARNADYLREHGYKVYAYDPFNGSEVDGWMTGNVSNKLPDGIEFDLVFTAYVLNVVTENTEDKIISSLDKYSTNQIHITRNMDIYEMIKNAVKRQGTVVRNFFEKEFVPKYPAAAEEFASGNFTKETLVEFAKHGTETTKGFQRIPELSEKGFQLVEKESSYKAYVR